MEVQHSELLIKQLIQTTMITVELNVEIKQEYSGINMSYNFISDCIGFDTERVTAAINEMDSPVLLGNYIETFTLHELGHAMDRTALLDSLERTLMIIDLKRSHTLSELYNNVNLLAILIEEHEMNIVFEETAWANAEKLNEKYGIVDIEVFMKLKAIGLATYVNLYNEDLSLYNRLIEEQSKHIA